MNTVIQWIDIKERKPCSSGWYMTICMPVNYYDFSSNPNEMNDWIAKFGIDKTWFNNEEFWSRDRMDYPREITERVIFWAEIPKVPML